MQNAETISNPTPIQPVATAPTKKRGALSTIILLLLTAIVIGAGLGWLQWASQRGIELGYPKPSVSLDVSSSQILRLHQNSTFKAQGIGRNLTYSWDFGDQSTDLSNSSSSGTANGQSVSYAYNSNGAHTITVTVRDEIGQTSSASTTVNVLPPPPTASFTSSIYSFFGTYTVDLDASASSADSSTSIQSYMWDFGDGTTVTKYYSYTNHDYQAPGTYTIKLIVIDQFNQQSDPYTATVTLSNNNS